MDIKNGNENHEQESLWTYSIKSCYASVDSAEKKERKKKHQMWIKRKAFDGGVWDGN